MAWFIDEVAQRVRAAARQVPDRERDALRHAAQAAPAPREFYRALAPSPQRPIGVIGEIRSLGGSPAPAPAQLEAFAQALSSGGAAAISVTAPVIPGGLGLPALRLARALGVGPLLYRDVTVSAVQLLRARAAGADAVSLTPRILTEVELEALVERARSLGMEPCLEVESESDVARAMACAARVVIADSRSATDYPQLFEALPYTCVRVVRRGVRNPCDVFTAARHGAGCVIIVGRALLETADPAGLLASMATAGRHPAALLMAKRTAHVAEGTASTAEGTASRAQHTASTAEGTASTAQRTANVTEGSAQAPGLGHPPHAPGQEGTR